MERTSDVILIIPAYNEAGNIMRVVDELAADFPQYDYVVVLDGPTDGTDKICREKGYHALYQSENEGLTRCIQRGMQYALQEGYPYAVQFDGDGQHRPEYVSSMVEKAKEGFQLVQGSRFLPLPGEEKSNVTMSTARRAGSFLLGKLIRMRTGCRVTDPTCGMRLYDETLIRRFAEESLSPEPSSVALFLREGIRYGEVPVRVAERASGKSYLKPSRALSYMLTMTGKILSDHS